MPKIPTFTAKGSIEQFAGTTKTPQISLTSTLPTALAPATKMLVNQKIQETNAQNQAEALKLENNFITDFIKVSETINTDEVMSVNKDVANKYLKDQSNNLINKYKSLATNNNVGIKFENYALAETQKTIFRTDTQISKNILKNLFAGYDKQKELLLITADTDESGMAKATLKSDLEKLTKDTFTSQVSAPELKIMLDSIPAEIDLMDGNKDVIQQPRKTFYSLKDKNYLPNLTFEQRQKLKEKAITIIRPQITTEWKNYTASVMAGKEPPAFDMKLATEIMTKPVADKMLQEESIIKDTVINNNLILTSPAKDLNELYKNIIDESYEFNTELEGQALETHYQTILKKREDGINKDPINFILQTNNSNIEELKGTSVGAGPVFSTEAEALAISQKNIELASALADEQTKLGIPESQHRFMTNEQATGFVNSYIALAEQSDEKGMQNLMLSLGNDYGVFESKVIAQLKTSGLPEGAEIALSLGNSELAIEALSLDTKKEKEELKSFLKRETDNETKFDDISIMISEEMKEFEAILRKNVPLDSSATLPEMEKLIDFLTYAAINRMYGKDMNAENAAESAANTFLNNFHLEDTYFIPKIYDGQDISASVDGIIDKANVLKDYYLPEFNAVAFKSATERDEALLTNKMKSQMQTNGQWRNTPDGEGLVFGIVLANGSFAPVVNEKGEELAFKFNDTTYNIPGTSENFDINLKYNEDLENVYAMGGAIKVDLDPVAVKKTSIMTNESIVNDWGTLYQTTNDPKKNKRALKAINKNYKIPNEAKNSIEKIVPIFEGDKNLSKQELIEYANAIGQIESGYKTKIQIGGGPARSYWQVEPTTALDLLNNSSAIFGPKFEKVFSIKYGKNSVKYLSKLSKKEMSTLLEKDSDLAVAMALGVIVSRK